MAEARKEKKNLFEGEANLLVASRDFLDRENLTIEDYKGELLSIHQHYEDLVDQSKLITKVSDRLQKKINRVNDKLEDQNIALQESLDALTKAKVGRKATTIVLVLFIVIFILVEGFIEPPIDRWASQKFEGSMVLTITLAIKGVLALLLRPIERLVEKILMKQAQKEQEQAGAKPA